MNLDLDVMIHRSRGQSHPVDFDPAMMRRYRLGPRAGWISRR